MKFRDSLIVVFVWFIIMYEFFSYIFLFSYYLIQQNIILFLLIIPIFIILVTLLCISYYRAIHSSPGIPTFDINTYYLQEIQEIKIKSRVENQDKKIRRKNKINGIIDMEQIAALNRVGYCFKCDLIKQPRVHHCKLCQKCIIRMDHHCPWIGNCVGKYNHKYFILFLFYATLALMIVAISITIDFSTGPLFEQYLDIQLIKFIYLFTCISSYFLSIAIGFLFITQIISSCNNLTTLQTFTQGIKQRNPWRQENWSDNLKEIFGYSNWFLPSDPFSIENRTSSIIL